MIFGRMENDAAASTTASKAISADQATAAHAAVAANQSLAITEANVAKTSADASIDAAPTAANGLAGYVYAYTVASIGVGLVATTASTGFALLRENSGITAVSAAQRSAINAGYTKAIADLAADLAGRNANDALDDPIAVAAAQQSATDGVRAARQHINNLQARAAETFAGTGPSGWGMTIAAGMGYVNDAFEIAWAWKTGEFQGLAAWADGFIPFFDPFDSLYDPTDSTLQWSQFFGGVSREALLTAATLGVYQYVGGATYGIGVARNGHWMYNVTSNGSQTWYHLAGMNRLGQMVTTRGTEYYFRSGRWLGSLEGIPIFFPGAAGTATSSGNCFWTCIVGIRNGLIGF